MSKETKNTNVSVVVNNGEAIDFFRFDKSLGARVSEYFCNILAKAEIHSAFKLAIDEIKTAIASYEKLRGSATHTDEDIDNMVATANAQIEKLTTEYETQLDAFNKFALNDAELTIKKVARNFSIGKCCLSDLRKAMSDMLSLYGVTISADHEMFTYVLASVGYKVDIKTLVMSDGKETLKFRNSSVIDVLFGTLFNYMVVAGTIKSAQIPSVLVERFITIPRKKAEAKKAQKKNRK